MLMACSTKALTSGIFEISFDCTDRYHRFDHQIKNGARHRKEKFTEEEIIR
jgi:hypothetical protein